MTFKEIVESLKGKIQGEIKPESSPEEIEKLNGLISELDSLETSHNEVVTENAKFKDTIVRMVTSQGDSNPPLDGALESKPKTIEECVAEELAKEKK